MSPRVLILAGLYDFSADLVAIQLESAGVPYVRLNREQLADNGLTLDPVSPELTVRGPNGICKIGSELKAIWFRQPVFLRNTPSVPLTPSAQLERSQWTAFLRSLCVFREAAWMNFPAATYLAESKPYQLFVAERCGFRTPQTLASNDAKRLRYTFPATLVVKSLDTVLLRDGDDCLFRTVVETSWLSPCVGGSFSARWGPGSDAPRSTGPEYAPCENRRVPRGIDELGNFISIKVLTYTTINSADQLCEETVHSAPLLAQQALSTKTDIRVTIVGDRVFAVRILSHGRGIPGDWRTTHKADLEYEDFVLDEHIAQCCHRLAEALELNFAAIDLLETPAGIYFVEVNPTGEWGWLSSTERPIHKAIASWLTNPINRQNDQQQ